MRKQKAREREREREGQRERDTRERYERKRDRERDNEQKTEPGRIRSKSPRTWPQQVGDFNRGGKTMSEREMTNRRQKLEGWQGQVSF